MEKTIFDTICARLELGALLSPPVQLTGGFLHQMYSFFTQKGKYALKLLNPEIMARETAMENYRAAEALNALKRIAYYDGIRNQVLELTETL